MRTHGIDTFPCVAGGGSQFTVARHIGKCRWAVHKQVQRNIYLRPHSAYSNALKLLLSCVSYIPMGLHDGLVSELVASGIALGTLLLVWFNVLARRARVSPPWHIFQTFITREDVAAGLAEEAADKERLAILSGENLNNDSSSTSGPDLEPINEATPLIKRPTPSRYRSWHSIFFAVLG
ncbi:hypothetical protein BS47DRAFT_1074286 [Hydnum rufescens UP504]|uniref:Uncharacterized protein n=1 Tax=Hydnum rufescens UP504 TaxID=1448309 RepID=A0A9P6B8U8_9AGAM|nr:hypothetical protein BS47DRAFT_1074286 [Hydnum rufescens UP504]